MINHPNRSRRKAMNTSHPYPNASYEELNQMHAHWQAEWQINCARLRDDRASVESIEIAEKAVARARTMMRRILDQMDTHLDF
jgi:hypothetical protein